MTVAGTTGTPRLERRNIGSERPSPGPGRLDLYWIPLGAGDRAGQSVVRFCGRVFERAAAFAERRAACDLFHAALVAETGEGRVYVEMAPMPDDDGSTRRGVVAQGAVGWRALARLRLFRYEVRRWPNGTIPDLAYAIDSPVHLTDNQSLVEEVLDLLPDVPTPVWGRDELRTGEMWNSNSLVSWALTRAGLCDAAGHPPNQGRAPGWHAGVEIATRSEQRSNQVANPAPDRGGAAPLAICDHN